MEFKHVLVDSQEAHALASSEPADLHVRVLVLSAIYAAVDANTLTATVVVSTASSLIRTVLLDELIQLGYAVDGTTTPGSFIITW
jgi:hypothetical protein